MKKSAEKSAALGLESAFFFSKGERERVRHFEERANALVTMDDCEQPFSIR